MATLTIDFTFKDPELSLKGLSFKILKGNEIEKRLYRDDASGKYTLETRFNINPRTAMVEEVYLVKMLKSLKMKLDFDKIKYKGRYQITPEKLLELINSLKVNH